MRGFHVWSRVVNGWVCRDCGKHALNMHMDRSVCKPLAKTALGLVAECADCRSWDNVARDPDNVFRCSGHSIR